MNYLPNLTTLRIGNYKGKKWAIKIDGAKFMCKAHILYSQKRASGPHSEFMCSNFTCCSNKLRYLAAILKKKNSGFWRRWRWRIAVSLKGRSATTTTKRHTGVIGKKKTQQLKKGNPRQYSKDTVKAGHLRNQTPLIIPAGPWRLNTTIAIHGDARSSKTFGACSEFSSKTIREDWNTFKVSIK